ncbi:DUF4291 domain-containing protein [Actinocorallia herbida]|nr:DUF4291 domain-containing protein [Actinocorallia herbida]
MQMYEIRADYDADDIVVYQAYGPAIGDAAVRAGGFVPPFSRTRMTWIKPSFLWLMERSGWGRKPGQERILGVRISRSGWESALRRAVLTSPERDVHGDSAAWRKALREADVRVQWDPERTLRGGKLEARSIQVGVSRHAIDEYADEWVREIVDLTPLTRRIHRLVVDGRHGRARDLLPPSRPYPFEAPHLRLS